MGEAGKGCTLTSIWNYTVCGRISCVAGYVCGCVSLPARRLPLPAAGLLVACPLRIFAQVSSQMFRFLLQAFS